MIGKKFLKFNLYGFIYLILTPLVGIGMYMFVIKIKGHSLLGHTLGIVNLLSCMLYGYFYAVEVFRSYKDRLNTYLFIREKLFLNNFTKKSILWSLKQKPCGDIVIRDLETEFGEKLWK